MDEERIEYQYLYQDLKSVDNNLQFLGHSIQDFTNLIAKNFCCSQRPFQETQLNNIKSSIAKLEKNLSHNIMLDVASRR